MFRWLRRKFLTIFGDIKVFPWPMWIVYDPVVNQISGTKLREVLNTLKRGDVLARGYTRYLDGYFIPGVYSHTGIYIGDGMMIHSVAEGVCKIDVLDFLQCDRVAVIRPKTDKLGDSIVDRAIETANSKIGTKYDFAFAPGDEELYCHEFTALCYKGLKLEKHIPTILWGLIKGKHPVYLAQSFIESEDFEVIYKS